MNGTLRTAVFAAGITLAGLAGCSTTRTVSLNARVLTDPSAAPALAGLASPRVYLVLSVDGHPSLLDGLFGLLLHQRNQPVRIDPWVRSFSQSLSSAGARLVAFRMTDNIDEADPFLQDIEPNWVVYVHLSAVEIDQTETTDDFAVHSDSSFPHEKTVANQARLSYEIRSGAYPGGRAPSVSTGTVEMTEGASDDRDRSVSEAFERLCGREAAGKAYPISQVKRKRPFFKTAASLSEHAYQAARKNQWEQAQRDWTAAVSSLAASWQDAYDLGVALERRGDYALARRSYEQARQMGRNDPRAGAVAWQRIDEELSQSVQVRLDTGPVSAPFFEYKLAVLPFGNDTNSLAGPDLARRIAYDFLQESGYRLVPLQDVDRLLRDHGVTQGDEAERLKDPGLLCQWLGADQILYGHLTKFDRITLGVIASRTVSGRLSLWDRELKQEIWSTDREITNDRVFPDLKPRDVAAQLIVQLIQSLIENILQKPLGAETLAWAQNSLSTLPMKPPPNNAFVSPPGWVKKGELK